MNCPRFSRFFFALSLVFSCLFSISANAASTDHFVTTWKTDNVGTSGDTSITIPTSGTGYAYQVDWNNDGDFLDPDEATINNGSITHNFGSVDTYTIRIKGDFPRIYFNNGGDKLKIISLEQWGTGQWTSMLYAFAGAQNLMTPATDAPDLSAANNLGYMFSQATLANPNTRNWNTSTITGMYGLFQKADNANPDTSNWNTENVTTMGAMFNLALVANPDTSGWNTSKVNDMKHMFQGAPSANPDTSNWDTSNVEDMEFLFHTAISATPNTSGWNTTKVTDMFSIFHGAKLANPDTSNWDTSNVIRMNNMFSYAIAANPITSSSGGIWDTQHVTDMSGMFSGATNANPDVSGWVISQGVDMTAMFNGVKLPTASYDAMLNHWLSQAAQSNISFDAGLSNNCHAQAARNNLTADNTLNWHITDAGQFCPAANSAPDLISASDTGTANTDNITSINIPTLNVDCPTVGATLTLYSDQLGLSSPISTHSCTAQGTVSVTVNYPLTPTTHAITYTATQSGTTSAQSPAISVVIMPSAALKAPDLIASSDTGSSDSDDITANTSPDFSIFCPGASHELRLVYGISNLEVARHSCTTKNWVTVSTTTPFNDATHQLSVISVDGVGNKLERSASLSVIVNTVVPTPTITMNVFTEQSSVNSQNIWVSGTVSGDFKGGDNITLTVNGNNYTGVVNATGHFSIEIAKADLFADESVEASITTISATNVSGSFNNTVNVVDYSDSFIFTVKTDNDGASDNNEFTLPLLGSDYNFRVDCANDGRYDATVTSSSYSCRYNNAGTYQVVITPIGVNNGGLGHIAFNHGDSLKLISHDQWGSNVWTSMAQMFEGASNLTSTASDVPNLTGVTDLSQMFFGATKATPNTTHWQTDNVTDFSLMFYDAASATPDTSTWNTAKATNMASMFSGAFVAKPDTSAWDTASVTNMNSMFLDAILANPNMSSWLIEQVTDMQQMLVNSGLSNNNYDAMLQHMTTQNLQLDVQLDADNVQYCRAQIARDNIIATFGWQINDDGSHCEASDNQPPVTSLAPDLSESSDLGYSNSDNITADATPAFLVACHKAGNKLTIFSDNISVIGAHICQGLGLEEVTTSIQGDGTHLISYTEQNSYGVSAPSPALAVTINQQVPNVSLTLDSIDIQDLLNAKIAGQAYLLSGQLNGSINNQDAVELIIGGQAYQGIITPEGRFTVSLANSHFVTNGPVVATVNGSTTAGISDTMQTPISYTIQSIDANATALLSQVAGIPAFAIATDQWGEAISDNANSPLYFSPGKHFVKWSEFDSDNNERIIFRQLNLFPLVTIAKDTLLQEGNTASINVYLNGSAPYYPFFVPFSVTGSSTAADHDLVDGTVTFTSQRHTKITIHSINDDQNEALESIIITLAEHINRGSNYIQTTTLSDVLIAPTARLLPYQNQQQNYSATQDGGYVTIKLLPDVGIAADYIIRWQPSIEGLSNLATEYGQFTFDPTTVELSNVSFVVQVTDIHQQQIRVATNVTIYPAQTDVTSQPRTDSSCFVAQGSNVVSDSHLVEAEFGVCLSAGETAVATHSAGLEVNEQEQEVNEQEQEQILPVDEGFKNIGGIFDYIAFGLAPSATYHIVFPQNNPIPLQPIFRKLTIVDGVNQWRDYIIDESNYLSSASNQQGLCPTPNDPSWQVGLVEGKWCVQLTITDGGLNDDDGQANGIVVDPGGVSTRLSVNNAPIAINDSSDTLTDQPISIDVMRNDSDPDGDILMLSSVNSTSGLAEIKNDQIRFTPDDGFTGEVIITYQIIDPQGLSAQATIRIVVRAPTITKGGETRGGSLTLWLLLLIVMMFVVRVRPIEINAKPNN